MANSFLNEHRCKCGKLLLKGIFFDSTLEIKCKKCGTINKIGILKLADDATHYLLIIDDRGIISNVSESASRILGYTCDELIGKHFTQVNPTMSAEMGKKFFGPESVLSEDNHLKLDTFHQSKNGKKIPNTVLLKLYKPTGKKRYVLLSAALRSAKAARNDKNFDKSALDFLENGCDFWFEVDKNIVIEYLSPSMEKIFGLTPEKLLGNFFINALSDKEGEGKEKIFKRFSSTGQPFRILDDVGVDSNRRIVHNELYFTPRFNDHGKFIGYRVLGWVKKP